LTCATSHCHFIDNGTNVKTNSASLDAPSSAEAQAEMENVMAQVKHHGPHAVA
jgi:hypothetical protein